MARANPYIGLLKHPRTGIYWYRRGVPAAARKAFGKREINQTLGTQDRRKAILAWGPVHAEWTQKLEEARNPDRRRYSDAELVRYPPSPQTR